MSYKVGQKVLVEAEIVAVDCNEPKYNVRTEWGANKRAYEHEIHPMSKTYEDGLNEAWEMAKKIVLSEENGGYSDRELIEIFCAECAYNGSHEILQRLTATEAADKVATWEDGSKQIHVGDVARIDGCGTAVVTQVRNGDCQLLFSDGGTGYAGFANIHKTGRHIDIAGLLVKIGGDSE